jgi:hypothetical protein
MSLVSVLGCGTWFFPIEEQLYYLKTFRFDVGYEFQHMPTRNSNSMVFPGAYEMRVHSFLIGVSYRFGERNKT